MNATLQMSVNCLTIMENCYNAATFRKFGTCFLPFPSRITALTSFICVENQWLFVFRDEDSKYDKSFPYLGKT